MEGVGADAVLARASLAAVTLTSGVSAYRAAAAGDVGSTAFVGVSYCTLLLLFHRLRAYERRFLQGAAATDDDDDDDDGRRRARLRREVWALSTLLTLLFAWRVAAAMPSWPVAAAVWIMAIATVVGGFVAMFPRHT